MAMTVTFFLLSMETARAPHGGKKFIGGRSIASLQEEDFDHQLLQYRLCYGVKFSSESATLERRRVCKAFLVNRLELALSTPGSYLKKNLSFECNDTVFRRGTASSDETVFHLRPNSEFVVIDQALQENLTQEEVPESDDRFARKACAFLTDCKRSMTGTSFSFRKLGSCFFTNNITHRKILLDQVGSMLFHAQSAEQGKILFAELLHQPHPQ